MEFAGDTRSDMAVGLAPGTLMNIILDYEGTGRNIKRLMEGSGHNAEDIAAALSVSIRLVYGWLSGETGVRPEHAIRLSRLYGVPLEKIYAVKVEEDY